MDDVIHTRKALYEKYWECLSYLENKCEIKVIMSKKEVNYNNTHFTVKSYEKRDYIFKKLPEYNVHPKKYFYPPCNEFPTYDFENNTPIAKNISDTIYHYISI